MQEAERRRGRQKRVEAKYREAHPILSRVQAVFADAPKDSGRSWEVGAVGEQRIRAYLDTLGDAIHVLHDRRIPETKWNLDHLAITATGVWVIDAKRYTGRIERRDVGGWFKTDERLCVNDRDKTKLVGGVNWQVQHLSDALDLGPFSDVVGGGALWFVDAEIAW